MVLNFRNIKLIQEITIRLTVAWEIPYKWLKCSSLKPCLRRHRVKTPDFPGNLQEMTLTWNCCCRLSLSFQRFSSGFFLDRTSMLWRSSFCWRTFRPRKYGWDSRRFWCFIATCKRTDVIWWLKMGRANSRVLCHLKIYPDISSYCNNPLSEHTFVVWKLMKRNFHAIFLIHFLSTAWNRAILRHDRPMIAHAYHMKTPNNLAAGPQCLVSIPLSPDRSERPPFWN